MPDKQVDDSSLLMLESSAPKKVDVGSSILAEKFVRRCLDGGNLELFCSARAHSFPSGTLSTVSSMIITR